MTESNFQFSNPVLQTVDFKTCDDFDAEKFDGISMDSNAEFKLLNNQSALVTLTINIGMGKTNQPFRISVSMQSEFYWDDKIDEKKAKKMLEINGSAVLLSYIRPIVASLTNSSRYSALNIPFIDFTKGV